MSSTFLASSGMPPAHFEVFRSVAEKQQKYIVVRNTNPRSKLLIQDGYPAKPVTLKVHTDDQTGKVTARTPAEVLKTRELGFFVLDSKGVPVGRNGQPFPFPFPVNPVNRPGEVIDPVRRKAFVGDYDLQGVFDPGAPGRNIALVSSHGRPVENVSNPEVERIRALLNAGFDLPRVMHGPQDMFESFRGGCTAFLPDGSVVELRNEQDVIDFYKSLGRQTSEGTYRDSPDSHTGPYPKPRLVP